MHISQKRFCATEFFFKFYGKVGSKVLYYFPSHLKNELVRSLVRFWLEKIDFFFHSWKLILTCVGETSDLSMPPEPVALENKAKATLMAILIRLLVLSGSSSY